MNKILFIVLLAFYGCSLAVAQENVQVETDRDIYIAGEDLFFRVIINSNGTDQPKSRICYILLRNSKNPIQTFYIKTTEGSAHGSFYIPDTLKTGYYELVAFTNYMRGFGEESYFRKQIVIANRFDEWLTGLNEGVDMENGSEVDSEKAPFSIKADKETYRFREKVTLSLKSDDLLKNVGITVKEANPYSRAILKNQRQTDEKAPISVEKQFKPETSGIILYGKLLNGDNPVENECLFLSAPDTIANLQYCFTNEKGEFSFNLTDYYLGKNMIISTKNNQTSGYKIAIEDKFKLRQPFIPQKIQVDAALRKYIFESQNIVQVHKAYNFNYKIPERLPQKESRTHSVYYKPTRVVHPSNFVVLNSFDEIANNLIEGYRIRNRQGIYDGYHINPADGLFFNEPGAIFVNGVYIYNLNPVMKFTSADVSKIEVCNESRIKGRIGFPGIISIYTKKDIDFQEILPQSTIIRLDKFLETTIYKPLVYEKAVSHDPLPDFRQTLYWNPEANKPDHSFTFYTSDWPAEFIVEVNATTKEGKPVSSFTIINVQKP